MEKVSRLPGDTSMEKDRQHPEGDRTCVLNAGWKLYTFLSSELKSKGLNPSGFLSSLNHSLLLGVLTNVFPI